jgi:hypothetical protein
MKILSVWSHISEFPGLISAFSGTAGILFGAWLTSRKETKKAVIAELNSINSAAAVCFSIANKYMSLKKQHVRPMFQAFMAARAQHEKIINEARSRPSAEPLTFELFADLQTMSPVWAPVELLERLVFEKTSARGRALVAAVDLISAIGDLEQLMKARNVFIDELRSASPLPTRSLVEKYLGITSIDGNRDERYFSAMRGISQKTDDCIFFSRVLADDLLMYGNKLRNKHKWRYRLRSINLAQTDWSEAERQGLLPSNDLYTDWLKGFATPVSFFVRSLRRIRRTFTQSRVSSSEK